MGSQRFGVAISLCTLLLAGFATSAAQAMWARMTDDELIERSVLIVQGRYIGESMLTLEGKAYHIGVIEVETSLKGPAQPVVLIARPDPKLRKSDDVAVQAGQTGLWLLEDSRNTGLYQLRHPQRFVPSVQAAPLLEKLHQLTSPSAP